MHCHCIIDLSTPIIFFSPSLSLFRSLCVSITTSSLPLSSFTFCHKEEDNRSSICWMFVCLFRSFDVISSVGLMQQCTSIDVKLNFTRSMWIVPMAKTPKHSFIRFVCWSYFFNDSFYVVDVGNHKMSTMLTLFELSIDNVIKYLCHTLATVDNCKHFANGKYM